MDSGHSFVTPGWDNDARKERDISIIDRARALIVLPVLMYIGALAAAQAAHRWAVRDAPLANGNIVLSQPGNYWGVPTRRLSVQMADGVTTVLAETSQWFAGQAPIQVRFRYDGDPNREVTIEGEGNPLWVALGCWTAVLAIILKHVIPMLKPYMSFPNS